MPILQLPDSDALAWDTEQGAGESKGAPPMGRWKLMEQGDKSGGRRECISPPPPRNGIRALPGSKELFSIPEGSRRETA